MKNIRETIRSVISELPDEKFVWVNGQEWRFGTERPLAICDKPQVVAIIAPKSAATYLTILSAIADMHCYVPLNVEWSMDRISTILRTLRPDILMCDPSWFRANMNVLEYYGVAPNQPEWAAGLDGLVMLVRSDGQACSLRDSCAKVGESDVLYIMFTSGSTGIPKGVPVMRSAADHYVAEMNKTFHLAPREKWIQAVELNFDLSAHDMLLAWSSAGSIVAIPANQAPMGPRFVRKLQVHNWLSVPSAAGRALSLGLLKPGSMPSLRRSFFCGEALPSDTAKAWQAAASNATLFNLYGPTEATIAITWHELDPGRVYGSTIPIGKPFASSSVRIDADGELQLGGPQVFHGYLDSPAETAAKLDISDIEIRWYKTGDRARFLEDGNIAFDGRLDWQVKVRGHRVEIEEVEFAIREVTRTGLAAVVGIEQLAPGSYGGLKAFVETGVDLAALQKALALRLPSYMVPQKYAAIDQFPQNANGKIDRLALARED
ncbi:AMP-binding protein [Abyssibius alkaniclasticus]|uniref:AMP-binding protein n=1 Tax=Abyssibius alkaniclasticus TaxID=2881234 RepID=UPI00405837CA